MNFTELALKVQNPDGSFKTIEVPSGIPTGGLEAGGAGQKVIALGIQLLIVATVIATLFFIIWAGIDWISSGGDKTAIQNAKNKIIYAIIGITVVIFSFFIINLVGYFFGVKLI